MASASATVIDLTDEPDSPVLQTRTTTGGPAGQQPGQPGQPGPVIDLTEIEDDDDDDNDVVISSYRTLPQRQQQWGRFDIGEGGGGGGGGGGSGPGHEPMSGARQSWALSRLNGFGVGGLNGLARLTSFALDSIPTLGNSGGVGVGGSSGRSTPAFRSGRRNAQMARPRPARGGVEYDGGPLYAGSRSIMNPLGDNQPDLNYGSNGSVSFHEQLQNYYTEEVVRHQQHRAQVEAAHRAHQHRAVFASAHSASSTKPPYVAPPEPVPGFTRSTGDDIVAVCVGCDEELVYDSNQTTGGGTGKEGERASKRKQSRREREEHPFWGVTRCGHVYCRRCFDNRRSVLKDARLPPMDFKTDGKSVFCAAEGCHVDVTAKKAWVGLFV